MARLTISLSDQRYRVLRQTAMKQNRTISQLIEECLEIYGVKTPRRSEQLVARARARSSLNEADALKRAVTETRAVRRR